MGCSQGCARAPSAGVTPGQTPYFEGVITEDDRDLGVADDPVMIKFGASLPQIQPWDERRFRLEKKLQDANRNSGCVNLMTDFKRSSKSGGFKCAVKRMPNSWVTSGPKAFSKAHPESTEKPWTDIAVLQHLNSQGCSFVCELVGIFLDQECAYIVSSLASGGDLFGYSSDLQVKGPARETALNPILVQIYVAVQQLHNLGISHRDLSPENVLLHGEGKARQIKLCDFGMATVIRFCPGGEARGKHPYQAPEMHSTSASYDSFLSDVFALGVLTFSAMFQIYPWNFTLEGSCRRFANAEAVGIPAWFKAQKAPRNKTMKLTEIVSEGFQEILTGMLEFDPARRSALGQRCYGRKRASIWDSTWAKLQVGSVKSCDSLSTSQSDELSTTCGSSTDSRRTAAS